MLNLIPASTSSPPRRTTSCARSTAYDLALGWRTPTSWPSACNWRVPRAQAGGNSRARGQPLLLRCRAHARGQREAGGSPGGDRRGVLGRSSPTHTACAQDDSRGLLPPRSPPPRSRRPARLPHVVRKLRGGGAGIEIDDGLFRLPRFPAPSSRGRRSAGTSCLRRSGSSPWYSPFSLGLSDSVLSMGADAGASIGAEEVRLPAAQTQGVRYHAHRAQAHGGHSDHGVEVQAHERQRRRPRECTRRCRRAPEQVLL